jgi:hypothetical protein
VNAQLQHFFGIHYCAGESSRHIELVENARTPKPELLYMEASAACIIGCNSVHHLGASSFPPKPDTISRRAPSDTSDGAPYWPRTFREFIPAADLGKEIPLRDCIDLRAAHFAAHLRSECISTVAGRIGNRAARSQYEFAAHNASHRAGAAKSFGLVHQPPARPVKSSVDC